MNDGLDPARGIIFALLLCSLFYALVYLLVVLIL